MSKEPQLHELLAVEQDLRGQASKILAETQTRFNKEELFRGSVTTYEPFSEEDSHLADEAHEEIGTTVPKRLAYTSKALARYWDAVLQKDRTNQTANADIVVDGATLAENVPATTLLGLETKLRDFLAAIGSMPTLDAKTAWIKAEDQGEGISQAEHEDTRFRTKKITKPVVMYEATPEHPAQVKEAVEDVHVGKITKRTFSGAVTSARAAEILSKTEKLMRAVKKARQRANKALIVKGNVGKALFDYVLG